MATEEPQRDPFLGKQIRIADSGTVRGNPADDDSYIIEAELGGIHQDVVVTEEFVQNQIGILFQCQNCTFDDPERETFDKSGMAMKCPQCGSTQVEQRGAAMIG